MILETVSQCNDFFSVRTLNPLASVIRLPAVKDIPGQLQFGFNALLVRGRTDFQPTCLGRKECDFSDGALVALQPNVQVDPCIWESGKEKADGLLLCFHNRLFNPCLKGKMSTRYSFFRYGIDESLQLSLRERITLEKEIDDIENELCWGFDDFSCTILAERIRLLLDYVSRFHKRQFILRHDRNQKLVNRADQWIEDFFRSGKARYVPLPTARDFAGMFGCTSDYFNDLLKHETGKCTEDYVNSKRISFAVVQLRKGDRDIKDVAADLGFPTDQVFCSLFRKLRGESPEDILSKSGAEFLN